MTQRFAQTVLTATALVFLCAGWSLRTEGATSDHVTEVSKQDKEFVASAAEASWAEIAMGQLAESAGTTEAVRQFGQRMVRDHTTATKELESIAGKLGIASAKQQDPKHEGDINVLAKATGAEFDRLYAGYMVTDHEKAVQVFQKHAKSGDNPELKQFAARQLSILQEHLGLARSLMSRRQ